MALTQPQITVAQEALAAAERSASGGSPAILERYDQLRQWYTMMVTGGDTYGIYDLNAFLGEAKSQTDPVTWGNIDDHVRALGLEPYTSIPFLFVEAGVAIKNGATALVRSTRNVLDKIPNPTQPVKDWFASLFGTIKWIMIGIATLIILFIAYKIARLFR